MERINKPHWAVFLSNSANKHLFVQRLVNRKAEGVFSVFNNLDGALFSPISLNEFIEEESKHEEWIASKQYNRGIKTLSSGEQKKALLGYLLAQKPDYIILDNPFDNLDIASQAFLLTQINEISTDTAIIQLINRTRDYLPFIANAVAIEGETIVVIDDIQAYIINHKNQSDLGSTKQIPPPIQEYKTESNELVRLNNVTVRYGDRVIVREINWVINAGEFWQLVGPNGSGKTTLLTMINGDNPKAYGQDIGLFGKKKGTGETVWEIKQKIGYLTPSMTDLFSTRHTVEQMIVSGFLDSIGLYKQPTDLQVRLANEWLELIEMADLKNKPFCSLSLGQQRLALVARAMVKHPPLLILDEAMAGLDDHNAVLVTALINKMALESKTAILYVSHRVEEGLFPEKIFQLTPTESGSVGEVL